MATIKPIEGRTIHQIQSGQVIVDLCSVVKELVENSLDAGATSIDVRFKNQGLDSIEVQDNGDGISPQNYETLALKHHTSKLSTYADLTTLQTFGFRGEALSSLCALSQFTVTTCMAADAPKGTKLEFETSGKLKGTSVLAAQRGTTMTVENLFNNLPVRRRELERNIKREWSRVVGVLNQYACIQTGIKFSVSQQAGKGKKTTLFSTKGNPTTRENIVNVYGAKTLAALVPLDLNLELEPTSAPSQKWSTQEDGGNKDIRVVGHISRPASGEGRQTPDRQMFFVNARPCGLPQVSKAFNEVYKAYNASQSPFIFANIELDTHLYDVNVSPDKRTILLHDQTRMLENMKEALIKLFDSQDYTVPISQLPAQKQPSYKQLTITRPGTIRSSTPNSNRATSEAFEGEESEDESISSKRKRNLKRSIEEQEGPSSPPRGSKSVNSAVSCGSLNGNLEAVSSISNLTGRGVEDRTIPSALVAKTSDPAEERERETRRPVEKLIKENEYVDAQEQTLFVPLEEPNTSISTTQSSLKPSTYKIPKPVADFNQRMAEIQKPDSLLVEDVQAEAEYPIPALRSPTKSPPSLSSRFSSTAKPQRVSPAVATITIGNQTITSSIGTPCLKRARLGNSSSTWRGSKSQDTLDAPLPSFGNRLTQRFAAPGITQSSVSSEDEIEDDTQENAGSLRHPASPSNRSIDEIPDSVSQKGTEEDQPSEPVELADENLETEEIDENRDDVDGGYIDEMEKKAQEDAKVEEMIQAAEDSAAQSSQANLLRAKSLLKGGASKKGSTVGLVKNLDISCSSIGQQFQALEQILSSYDQSSGHEAEDDTLDSEQAEEKLSLTISKPDFAKMKIIGQFNLGFILASRTSDSKPAERATRADDLFIIDQHASDEKYNFERLQSTTIVQSQRLVVPKTLDLTALEEEIVLENLKALETNGFVVTVDQSGESPVGQRCQVISLPISRETTFSLEDLDELLALLMDHPSGLVPRPSKVRKMFAMRACRSSIMIGKTLSYKQMENVVRHMGEIDKPWNCPHGRPTMRHLCGLAVWDELGWKEGDEPDGEKGEATNWAFYVKGNNRGNSGSEMGSDEEQSEEDILDYAGDDMLNKGG